MFQAIIPVIYRSQDSTIFCQRGCSVVCVFVSLGRHERFTEHWKLLNRQSGNDAFKRRGSERRDWLRHCASHSVSVLSERPLGELLYNTLLRASGPSSSTCVCMYTCVSRKGSSAGWSMNRHTGIRLTGQPYRYEANGGVSSSIFSCHPWMERKEERPAEGGEGARGKRAAVRQDGESGEEGKMAIGNHFNIPL